MAAKSESEARTFVRKLIAERVADGQLGQCPLTLAELARIEATFLDWLKARNHSRPVYPESPAVLADDTARSPRTEPAPA